jgi:hypothetical protein
MIERITDQEYDPTITIGETDLDTLIRYSVNFGAVLLGACVAAGAGRIIDAIQKTDHTHAIAGAVIFLGAVLAHEIGKHFAHQPSD